MVLGRLLWGPQPFLHPLWSRVASLESSLTGTVTWIYQPKSATPSTPSEGLTPSMCQLPPATISGTLAILTACPPAQTSRAVAWPEVSRGQWTDTYWVFSQVCQVLSDEQPHHPHARQGLWDPHRCDRAWTGKLGFQLPLPSPCGASQGRLSGSTPYPQAGKFSLIPTIINLATALTSIGVVRGLSWNLSGRQWVYENLTRPLTSVSLTPRAPSSATGSY